MDYKIKLFHFMCQICVVMSIGNIVENYSVNNILEACVVDIISSKTLHGTDVVIIKDDVFLDHVTKNVHESYNIKLYVKDCIVSMNIFPDTYVVHGDDKDNFKRVIDRLDKDWYRQPHALYIITLTNMGKDDLPEIFKILLEYHIIHVIIVVEEDEGATMHSYLPYAPGKCGRDPNNTIALGKCESVKNVDIVEMLRDYDKPDVTNCTFNVLAHHYPPLVISDIEPTNRFAVGIERFLVELLLETENISANYTFVPLTAGFGKISDNLTVTGIMANLLENRVDLLYGGYSLSYRRAVLFDFIYIHLAFEDIFIPVTRSADLEDRWKIVYIMFEYKVWLLLLLTMLFCSIILSDNKKWFVIRYINSSELLRLFGNATGNMRLNLRQKLFKNWVIVHWLWFTFLVSCYYQTRLTSYSTYRSYKPQINEYMSLAKYNRTPCINKDIVTFLISSKIAPIMNEPYLDTRSCPTTDLSLDEVAKSSGKYTVTPYITYLWWAARHLKEKSRLHVLQENIYQTHYTLFCKRGFPLLHKFSETMSHIVECGFVQAIKGMQGIPTHSRYADGVSGAFEVRLLTLNDLIIPFSILTVGYLFGLVVFIIEISNRIDKTFVMYQT